MVRRYDNSIKLQGAATYVSCEVFFIPSALEKKLCMTVMMNNFAIIIEFPNTLDRRNHEPKQLLEGI
jgi:hypothetical protein